jgi:hypothetical protein
VSEQRESAVGMAILPTLEVVEADKWGPEIA